MSKRYGNATWGAGLRKLRDEEGLSATALGTKIGLLGGSVSNIELGISGISKEAYDRLCAALPAVAALRNAPVKRHCKGGKHVKSEKTTSVKRITVKRNPGLVVKKPKSAVPVMRRVLFSFVVSLCELMKDRATLERIKAVIEAASNEGITLDELGQLLNAASRC